MSGLSPFLWVSFRPFWTWNGRDDIRAGHDAYILFVGSTLRLTIIMTVVPLGCSRERRCQMGGVVKSKSTDTGGHQGLVLYTNQRF